MKPDETSFSGLFKPKCHGSIHIALVNFTWYFEIIVEKKTIFEFDIDIAALNITIFSCIDFFAHIYKSPQISDQQAKRLLKH